MKRLRKYFFLTAGDRRLLVRAGFLLVSTRIGLWLMPFKAVQGMLARIAPEECRPGKEPQPSLERIAWAVCEASRYVPKATCLTQALAAQVLLKKGGYPASVRIGVGRDDDGEFQAHAWVESQGKVVLGGSKLARYTQLLPVEAKDLEADCWEKFLCRLKREE